MEPEQAIDIVKEIKHTYKYRVQHTTRSVGDHGIIELETNTVYEGTDKAVAEKHFCANNFSFGESSTLLVFSNDSNELIRYYERTK